MSNRCRKMVAMCLQTDPSSSSNYLNNSVEETELNMTQNELPPKKVQVIEHWLLGVQPKSIYAVVPTHRRNSISEKKKSEQSNDVSSQISPKYETLADTSALSETKCTESGNLIIPLNVFPQTKTSESSMLEDTGPSTSTRGFSTVSEELENHFEYETITCYQSNDLGMSSNLIPQKKASESNLLQEPRSPMRAIGNSKISEGLQNNFEDEKKNRCQSSSISYISDSYKSEIENEYDDDSITDPDYQPDSPNDHRIRNLNSSPHLNDKLSMESFEIDIIPQISIESSKMNVVPQMSVALTDELSQSCKISATVSSQESPVIVDSAGGKEMFSRLGNNQVVEAVSRKNYTDRKDFCTYCEKDVSHFARHMLKWHEQEFEVQRILSFNRNSKERRKVLSVLRKRGNFLRNRVDTKLRPVKRLQANQNLTSHDFLPCKYCLGFYMKKSLFRHTKKCASNYENDKKRQTSQSDGQTTLLLNSMYKHDELLKSKIFPRMRADDIGLIAKKDPLICKYAYSYVKGRQSKGNLDLVRTNMRRLAKLLQHAQRENNEIKQLIDILHPCHFQLIITGVNKMAKYNPETDIYESPTLAINFGTLIKKCCDLAYVELLQKKDTNEQRKDLKILKRLIESQWADEVSAQAGTNLSQNKWNQEELLPLTSDLKKLNMFLQKTSEETFDKLKTNENDAFAYNTLKELLYTQIILLNRRRPAEVAQLKVQTFKSINLENEQTNEFENCLTETEKILLSTYSRFIIRGKRGRGVPILLSPEMKKHFDFIVEVRSRFVTDNDYVFHTSGKGFIDGTKILHRYVNKCKLERPGSITATRLRKHLATITQLLQFSNNDMEQLSKFMGHTLKTHCNVYRMSDKIYQTAKVSELLLLMTEGGAEKYRGKTLDEIQIDLNPIYDNEITETINLDPMNQNDLDTERDEILNTSHNVMQKSSKVKSKKVILDNRQTWSATQKKIVAEHFSKHIKEKKPPKRHEVDEMVNLYPELFENKKWTSIKAIVYNIYTRKLKSH